MEEKKEKEWVRIDKYYPPSVDWNEVTKLSGTIILKKEIEWNGKPRKLVVLFTDEGEVTVWCTVRLLPLYDLNEGAEVLIINKGWVRTKSGRRIRDFEIWTVPKTRKS